MNIICAGEMMVDIIVRPVKEVKLKNDTCAVDEIRITNGGDANNNAVDFAKLGHNVTYMGRVGYDEMGDFVISTAKKAGICMDYVVRSKTAAQTKSLILIVPNGDRTFLQVPGTSAEFCFEDCDLSLLNNADLLQIGGAMHLERFDGKGSAALLKAAKNAGVTTSMDITSDRKNKWKGILDECYPWLDYFLPSIEHATLVAGTDNPPDIADFFLDRGVKNVAIKLGKRGSFFKNHDTSFYAGIYDDLNIVDTTGAGDAFCAGFLTGVLQGKQPIECVRLGTACSAFVIQAPGATTGMADLNTVNEFIKARPPIEIKMNA